MPEKTERRDFLKATVAAGVLAPAAVAQPARPRAINPNAKAVLPNGEVLTREQILARLGLDPKVAPDGWLVIINCGVNVAALRAEQIRELVRSGKIKVEELDPEVRQRLELGSQPAPGRR